MKALIFALLTKAHVIYEIYMVYQSLTLFPPFAILLPKFE